MKFLKNYNYLKISAFIFSIICQFIVASAVINRTVNGFSLTFWLLSIILLYFSFPFSTISTPIQAEKSISDKSTNLFGILIILFAIFVRICLMQNSDSFHIDEYLVAHFSYTLGDYLTKLDWFGVYPPVGVWICQFPLLFFLFQKIFFNIFDVSTLTMRLSIVPYILTIFVFLFLSAKKMFGSRTAILAIAILALLSPDLYLSKWALHFISSTALFTISVYFFVMSIKENKKIYFGLSGFFIALCYSTYYSSYIAIPIFILYAIATLAANKIPKYTARNYIFTLYICIFTLSPLVVYATKVDNFFTQRTNQVKLINGSWSQYKNITASPTLVTNILFEQGSLSIKSLYKDGIGGVGGYWFGHFALFDRTTFIFLIISILYFVYISLVKKDADKLFVVAVVLVSFIGGIVFSTPPPAFHRLSLAFPFIALMIAATISEFCELIAKKYKFLALLLLPTLLFFVLLSNTLHFQKILKVDGPDDPEFLQIEIALEQENANFVYIAAFDSYSLGKVLFIRSNKKTNSITESLNRILTKIPETTTSYLVILYPNTNLIEEVENKFPNSEIIEQYGRHLLMKISAN